MENNRPFSIHYARVMLAATRHFRLHNIAMGWADMSYPHWLLNAAIRSTQERMNEIRTPPKGQQELFA